ncbi:uncharacterized protein DFL_008898 [Arthrobotrys flagrans]|uniref:Uncharacterized protein n=1 Tax=Arthrobotrys flagrans TaxID=97331 RepID=A0A436ZQ40_ARTFL|nr:hypothetical protein DFL_008898 [Arthrobotrys flagrans]
MKFTCLEALILVSSLAGAAQAGKVKCDAKCTLMSCFPTWCKQKNYVKWKTQTQFNTQYFTITMPGKTVSVTGPGSVNTVTVTAPGGDDGPATVTKTETVTAPGEEGSAKTITVTAPGEEGSVKTITVTVTTPGSGGETVTKHTTCTVTKTPTPQTTTETVTKTVTIDDGGY